MRLLKNQVVAWLIAVVMIAGAISIGWSRANAPGQGERPDPSQNVPGASSSFVWDDASVLSRSTIQKLDRRNEDLWRDHGVVIGVVTCDYGREDLYDHAWGLAEEMELSSCDMIVVLDISGENYYLLAGSDLARDFTDQDCGDYAWEYMEAPFARGDYDKAVLKLTEALEDWYDGYYR